MTLLRSLLGLAGFSLISLEALAADPPGPPDPALSRADATSLPDQIEVPPVTPAPDTLAGHIQLAVGPTLALPFARLDNRTTFRDTADTGFGLGADVGIGVSRSVVVGGYLQYLKYSEANECPSCDPTSLAFGAFVRYHLVQGVRFDPWTSVGIGYRTLDTGSGSYSGVEWLRFSIGGDWYALSQLGFGPYLELDLGTFTDRPSGTDAAVYATFAAGLRLAFDLQGK